MNKFTCEIWDKASPVNGVAAQTVIQTHGIAPEDGVYLIGNGRRVLCIQTSANTPFPAATIEESARLHLEDFQQAVQRAEAEEHPAQA